MIVLLYIEDDGSCFGLIIILMEEFSSSDKEIQASFETVKGEITVSESELDSKEGVRRVIRKYQGRITEMYRVV